MATVRTRFAPSPTGHMHIGGMRTAIYNWLYARQHGGQFILRIDDTDRSRHVEDALPSILHSLKWMGIHWDEEPYHQSKRTDIYIAAAERLLSNGKAEKVDGAVKLKLDPNWSSVVIHDKIRGRVEFPCDQYADGIPLCRADGSPLYNLATVIDDYEMGITHVIRAEEHLSNVAPQILIAEALGYNTPTHNPPAHVHIPFVKEPGSNLKFSKRSEYRDNPRFKKLVDIATKLGVEDSPAHVSFYEKIGVLPIALFNALLRTGWSYDDKTECLSREEAIEKFSLAKVSRSPAEFDPDKLLAFSAYWLGKVPFEEKLAACRGFVPGVTCIFSGDRTKDVVALLDQRLKVASDIYDYPEFFCPDDQVKIDEAVFDLRVRKDKEAVTFLLAVERVLQTAPHQSVADTINECLTECNTTIGRMVHALRVSVTGKASGPNIIDIMVVLGNESCLNRIAHALSK